jgi:hypothetical protein
VPRLTPTPMPVLEGVDRFDDVLGVVAAVPGVIEVIPGVAAAIPVVNSGRSEDWKATITAEAKISSANTAVALVPFMTKALRSPGYAVSREVVVAHAVRAVL